MISNFYNVFAIKYSDILWMYKTERYNQYLMPMATYLVLRLKNGKKEYTDFNIEFCNEIKKHYPYILEDFSLENRRKYKEVVKQLKNN